ncbi:MAG: WecB/TagA/CpsF family glycosyltransferase [Smithellaceae bacterium]|nr:WecB/TagA/CpsF family glycosyltransferase [Smithellaceae bacterium]
MTTAATVVWPKKYDLLGVPVSVTNYQEAEDVIIRSAQLKLAAVVTHLPVHGIVLASGSESFRTKVGSFQMVAPDGQPVRWGLNLLYGTSLPDRVYGPELMRRLCRRAAKEGVSVYLYGSLPEVVNELRARLLASYPQLMIAGIESPPFRPLTEEEDKETIRRIADSGAGLVFLGLGCPRQDFFAFEHRRSIRAVQLCVGAAFDFISGNKRTAPPWMQRSGLEWLYRLLQEPGRLWQRYLFTNTIFLGKFALQFARQRLIHSSADRRP